MLEQYSDCPPTVADTAADADHLSEAAGRVHRGEVRISIGARFICTNSQCPCRLEQ